jgi:hypothetical protein
LLNRACDHGYITEHLQAELAQMIKTDDLRLRNFYFAGYLCFRSFLRGSALT